jgi:hypothetical protein
VKIDKSRIVVQDVQEKETSTLPQGQRSKILRLLWSISSGSLDTPCLLRHFSSKFIGFIRETRLQIAFRLVMAFQLFPDLPTPRPTQAEKFNFARRAINLGEIKFPPVLWAF